MIKLVNIKNHLILCLLPIIINGCQPEPATHFQASGKVLFEQRRSIWKVGFFPNTPAMSASSSLASDNTGYNPLAVTANLSQTYKAMKSVVVSPVDGSYSLKIPSVTATKVGYLVVWRAKRATDDSFELAGRGSTNAYFAVRKTGNTHYLIAYYKISAGLLYYIGEPISGRKVGSGQFFSAFQKDMSGFDFYNTWPLPIP